MRACACEAALQNSRVEERPRDLICELVQGVLASHGWWEQGVCDTQHGAVLRLLHRLPKEEEARRARDEDNHHNDLERREDLKQSDGGVDAADDSERTDEEQHHADKHPKAEVSIERERQVQRVDIDLGGVYYGGTQLYEHVVRVDPEVCDRAERDARDERERYAAADHAPPLRVHVRKLQDEAQRAAADDAERHDPHGCRERRLDAHLAAARSAVVVPGGGGGVAHAANADDGRVAALAARVAIILREVRRGEPERGAPCGTPVGGDRQRVLLGRAAEHRRARGGAVWRERRRRHARKHRRAFARPAFAVGAAALAVC